MKKRNLLAFGIVLLAIGGIAMAQQPPRAPTSDRDPGQGPRPTRTPPVVTEDRPDPLVRPDLPRIEKARAVPTDRIPAPTALTPSFPPAPVSVTYAVPVAQATREAKPDEMTIDQLLEAVENLRTQKEEMEKKEKAMLKVLRQKAEKLNQRLNDLDGEGRPQIVPGPATQAIYPTAR